MNPVRSYVIPALLIILIGASVAVIVPQSFEQISFWQDQARTKSQLASVIQAVNEKSKLSPEFIQGQNLVARIDRLTKDPSFQSSAQLMRQRKELLKQIMEIDPNLFLFIAKKSNRDQEVTVNGIVHVVQVDDYQNPAYDATRYYLQTPEITYTLYPNAALNVYSGSRITMTGYVIDDRMVVKSDTVKPIGISKITTPLESTGDQHTLVILVKNNSTDAEPLTPDHAHELIFDGQFTRFMDEQSYGAVSFSGDVYGWYALNEPGVLRGCHLLTETDMQEVIAQYDIDISKYGRVVFLNNAASGACSDIGKFPYVVNGRQYNFSMSSIGLLNYDQPSHWGTQPFGWTNLDFALSHELAHGLGLQHAQGWDCGANIVGDNCQHVDYGNYFDTMGTVGLGLHFNAYYKELLGWIPANKILNITESGTYTIQALETENAAAVGKGPAVAAKIRTQGSPVTLTAYYMETRRAIGFDSHLSNAELIMNQQGIMVNKVVTNEGPAFSRLLDMHSTNLPWYEDLKEQASLSDIFTDPIHGITIGPIVQNTDTSTTFKVNLIPAPCQPQQPSVYNVYGYPVVASNGKAQFEVRFTNTDHDTCEASAFHIRLIVPPGWTTVQDSDLVVMPETQTSQYVELYPVTATPGTYTIGIEITNTNSGLSTTYNKEVVVTEPLTITRITPNAGSSGSDISIVGSGFDEFTSRNTIIFTHIATGVSAVTEFVPASNGVITYTVPSTLRSCDITCTDISTPAGYYEVQVLSRGALNTALQNFRLGNRRPLDTTESPLITPFSEQKLIELIPGPDDSRE